MPPESFEYSDDCCEFKGSNSKILINLKTKIQSYLAQCFYFLLLSSDFPDEQVICPNFMQGDGESSSGEDEIDGNAVDELDCVKKVQEQFPQADGITFGDGTRCFAEFGWTHAADSSKWQTCKIKKQTGIWSLPQIKPESCLNTPVIFSGLICLQYFVL